MDRFRVEDLAAQAGESVDTIRFYQKWGLLPAPTREGRVAWYGPEHVERLARIRELQTHGLTLALIGRVVNGELDATDAPLAIAVADADAREEFLTLAGTLKEATGRKAGVVKTFMDNTPVEYIAALIKRSVYIQQDPPQNWP